jgi:tetratricopeptide (TPR) repeat protein
MLTTKNWAGLLLSLAVAFCAALLLPGCTPPGSRALLEGERLLRAGQYPQAIAKLQLATQLLPENAQAWNHLGLAHHKSNQANEALRAYQEALRRDPNLAAVRFNLGCLFLEQHNPQWAVSELTTYTLLQGDSPEGWLKLGTAQLRTQQLDAAERSFQSAIRLEPSLAEAWNGLGVIHTQRRRLKDAFQCFNAALQRQPNYSPALLNLATLYHHHLNNRALALQTYRKYLEIDPSAANAMVVRHSVRQLEAELAQAPARPAADIVSTPPAGPPASAPRTETNLAAVRQAPSLPAPVQPASERLPAPAESNLVQATPPPIKPEPPPQREPAPAPVKPVPESGPLPAAPPPMPEVVQLTEDPPPRIAQDMTPPPRQEVAPISPATAPLDQPSPLVRRATVTPTPDKRPLQDRMNPVTWFRGRDRPPPAPTPLTLPGASSQPETVTRPAPALSEQPATPAQPQPIPRYAYRPRLQPAQGDRAKADPFFAQGVQAHRERRLADAVRAYQQAGKLDPAFYEAHYNLGLAAYELKQSGQSLSAYEAALSIKPTSANALYNFALALQMAGYFQDAALELEKLLKNNPSEARAHFLLASLYADNLARPDLARVHYRKVLELEPQHPEALAIRFWLAATY